MCISFAVFRAALYGAPETLQILINSGVKPTSNLIYLAACTGNLNVLKYILNRKLNDVNGVDKDGCTALMVAVSNNKIATAK